MTMNTKKLLLAITLLTGFTRPAAAQSPGEIHGKVFEADGRTPIPFAVVRAIPAPKPIWTAGSC